MLLPGNAVEFGRSETADGVACEVKPVTVWDNSDGRYDEEIDDICQKRWGFPFAHIRSGWLGRIGRLNDVWHLVRLEKI